MPDVSARKFAEVISFAGVTLRAFSGANGEKVFRVVDPHRPLNSITARKIALVGMRLGDEGKGRAVPEYMKILTDATGLVDPVAMIVKVNGGANSGHTVYDKWGKKLALNLIPAGVVDLSIKYLALGADVLADPMKLRWEGLPLERAGFNILPRLRIDERTMVSDITHRIRDLAREATRKDPIGSTGRGIAPGYEDRADKSHIRFSIFRGEYLRFAELMHERIAKCISRVRDEYGLSPQQWGKIFFNDPTPGSAENPGLAQREQRANQQSIESGMFEAAEFDFRRYKGPEPFTLDSTRIIDDCWKAGQAFVNNIVNVGELTLNILDRSPQYIIYEHGQAIGLDVVHGDTPNTTSSNTTASNVPYSGRTRVTEGIHVVLVAKAYETAVGSHQLLAPMGEEHPLAKILMPQEKGVTTGRQRLVSWPCAVHMGDALRWHGAHDIVINKLDQLTLSGDWQGPLKICIGYRTPDGTELNHLPPTYPDKKNLKPIYRELPGWSEDISDIREFNNLPINAQHYIAALYASCLSIANEGLVSCSTMQFPRIQFIGVGPKQEQVVRGIPFPERLLELGSLTTRPPQLF